MGAYNHNLTGWQWILNSQYEQLHISQLPERIERNKQSAQAETPALLVQIWFREAAKPVTT